MWIVSRVICDLFSSYDLTPTFFSLARPFYTDMVPQVQLGYLIFISVHIWSETYFHGTIMKKTD